MPPKMPDTKNDFYNAFSDWINQRPGLEPCNYGSRSGLNTEYRHISEQKRRALHALRDATSAWVRYDPLTLREVMRAVFSGRLQFDDAGELTYTTGQYWPTEYRLAAAVVLEEYRDAIYRQDTRD